jgi:mono/diheme cytochrome c family protein
VKDFDVKTLTFHVSDGPTPAAGDKLLIGFGSQLQLGRVVYMKNCLHCHGVAGDGQGPTAKYLNPRPRDYRLGVVKFTSTTQKERATRDDLHRIVSYGIPGTYMPSFLLMKDEEKTAVVEYIRWLAMRGEMERRLVAELGDYNQVSLVNSAKKDLEAYEAAMKAGEKPDRPQSVNEVLTGAAKSFETFEKEDLPNSIDETADIIATNWQTADEESSVIIPKTARIPDTEESRLRGRVMYMSAKAKCYTCHGPLGRGDGTSTQDFWKNLETDKLYAERGLHDVWGHVVQPRDLTKGQYRGGRRPLDLFRRIRAGIKGTPMPAFESNALTDEQVWDLVNYVMNIPFETPASAPAKPPAMAAAHPQTEDGR